jgi:Flp pilus assembly protein TadG
MLTPAVLLRRRESGVRGSMTVEFVIVAPVLIVLMLFLVMAGRVVEARGQADGTARDAARAASIALNPGTAQELAQNAITADNGSNGGGVTCRLTNGGLQGFAPDSPAVSVRVQCTVALGFPYGTWTLTGYAVAPLDPFNARTYGP